MKLINVLSLKQKKYTLSNKGRQISLLDLFNNATTISDTRKQFEIMTSHQISIN